MLGEYCSYLLLPMMLRSHHRILSQSTEELGHLEWYDSYVKHQNYQYYTYDILLSMMPLII